MGGGASSKKDKEDQLDHDHHERDVDPAKYTPNNQTVALVDLVWKLNTGASPKSRTDWLRRKMWLTSGGILFYYSRQHDKPLGRTIRGLEIVVVKGKRMGRYLIEVHPVTVGRAPKTATMLPTILAYDTLEQRDNWVKKLNELKESMGDDTLEETMCHVGTRRRRMSTAVEPLNSMNSGKPDYGEIDKDCPDAGRTAAGTGRGSLDSTGTQASHAVDPAFVSALEVQPNVHVGLVGARHHDSDKLATHVPTSSSGCAWKPLNSVGPSLFGESDHFFQNGLSINKQPTDSPYGSEVIRRDSQAGFSSKENTILILDWDDTLFPTTWIRQDLQLNWKKTVAEQLHPCEERTAIEHLLDELSIKVEAFLRQASEIAQIFIVTLARRPWVDISAKNFMPVFQGLLKELDIPVLYARDSIDEVMEQEYNAAEFRSNEVEINFWMNAKAKCMATEITRMHSKDDRSWKNIMSFGDSEIERRALIFASGEHMEQLTLLGGKLHSEGGTAEVVTRDGHLNKLRTKTLKMIDDPSVEELTAEVSVMTSWMSHLVKFETGIDIELEGTEEDETLNQLNKAITGKDEHLSWSVLAGL